jgi:hypothetical protein
MSIKLIGKCSQLTILERKQPKRTIHNVIKRAVFGLTTKTKLESLRIFKKMNERAL